MMNAWYDEQIGYSTQTLEEFEASKAAARRRGFEIIEGGPRTLLLDLDSDEALRTYEEMLDLAHQYFGAKEKERWRSKSGKGWHIILETDVSLIGAERIALQACLGSDLKRELLSVADFASGIEEPSVLFKPPA